MSAVRYIVDDVDRSIAFYRDFLGFEVKMHPAPGFAALTRDDLTLYLNEPGVGSAGRAGGSPQPGGWNRFQLTVQDLEATVTRLTKQGATFRGGIATGPGGQQTLLQDPSGNAIELFEPASA